MPLSERALSALRVVGLVLAVGLLPLAIGIAFVQRGADSHADDTRRRALSGEARTQATNLQAYFDRSRSLILLAARDAAIRQLVNTPGGRRGQLSAEGDLTTVNRALGFLERLYPTAIGEACLIDGQGRELARVVRGARASREDLSLEEARSPFFAPTVALRDGQVFQAAPYESPDTHEWVISNSTPVPGARGPGGAMLHFEVTVESFRRQAAANGRRFDVAVVDAPSGRVAFDSRRPQRRGEPLASGDALRFGPLRGYAGRPAMVELPGGPAAVRALAAQPGNANRWLVVVTPAGSATRGIAGGIIPFVLLTVALLLGVGVAMAHRYQRVRDAALTDPITGLLNRRAFTRQSEQLAADATSARPLSLLVLDLDELESINTSRGHAAGEQVLRAVTSQLLDSLPDHGTAFRLAGTRLAVTLREGAWGAFELAGELHHALQDDKHIAVRIGVSEHKRDGRAEDLLGDADMAVAEARRSGRNVLVHTPDLAALAYQPPMPGANTLWASLSPERSTPRTPTPTAIARPWPS